MTTRVALADLCAADLMQRDLITVHADDPLHEVERVLADAEVSSVPVLDDTGTVLGVVSTHEVVCRHADADERHALDEDLDDEPDWLNGDEPCARDLMATDVVQVPPQARLAAMAKAMVENVTHRVLVVENGRLLGLVSTMDVLRAIAEQPALD